MNIAFLSDQFYPRTSADAEQIIASLSALGKLEGVTLFAAGYTFRKNATKEELSAYYEKNIHFNLEIIKHWFPNIRAIEKMMYALSAAFKVKGSSFDLVYTRNIPVVLGILLFSKLPVVFESYRPWPSRNLLAKWLFRRLASTDRFMGVVLHSQFAGKSFEQAGFEEEKLLLAHNAFDFEDYPNVIDPKEIRKAREIPQDALLVTYSGRVNKTKGVDRLIRLAKSFPELHFLIIGSENEGEIEHEANKLNNVTVAGWLVKSEVFDLLRASDILYIPPTAKARDVTKNTVLPLKTFIYKASGISILAPALEDVKEVLTHNENAWLVTPDNDIQEQKAISELAADPKLRKRLGETARAEMKALSWENRARSIQDFICKRLESL